MRNFNPESWKKSDIESIAATDDLHIAPFRADGKTYGTPTWIWSVVVDGNLYVRAYYGVKSRWYQAAIREKAGRIQAAGMTIDVLFEQVSREVDDLIDQAYRAKYSDSEYLGHMIAVGSKAATIRVVPREKGAK